jgi:branched-chain amino acid transport system ATP-binding protein
MWRSRFRRVLAIRFAFGEMRALIRSYVSRRFAHWPVSGLRIALIRQPLIAIAIASRPRMLLLDEPTAGLGPEESARMVTLFRELKREFTILLIGHDMDAVFALADRITSRPRSGQRCANQHSYE